MIQSPFTPEEFQLLVLRSALRLEVKGLKRSRRPSAASVIKKKFGLTARNNRELLEKYEALLVERGVLSG